LKTLAALIGLVWGGVDPMTTIWVAPLVGVVSTAIEVVAGGGLDNFFIQVGAASTAHALAI
jgi:dolichol kinase